TCGRIIIELQQHQ
ncbi:unnamed protein product, partial [Onchocerca ochengi]|uniref:Uncharacterized protein n=1 Tax=Onchocerca ochengi TaxID=42157 RepID=A0A182F0F7_ONCOC